MSKDIKLHITSPSQKKGQITPQNSSPNFSPKKRKKTNSLVWLEEAYNMARGETALWVAVISQAITDALSKCKKSESLYQKHEATCWLTSNSKDFIEVCLAAGMDPDYVRQKAKKALISSVSWRAEAGKGKRYQERKEYREKQRIKAEESKNKLEDKLENTLKILPFKKK